MEKHPPAYLSPSRLSCYTWCPAEFHKRYVLKVKDAPTPEQAFGTAVHAGLEALFNEQDDELAFLRNWREAKRGFTDAQQAYIGGLDTRGLELLDQVRGLGLRGLPERAITVVHPNVPLPFIGYVDLWDEQSKTITDFKTSFRGWGQEKADQQIFQPAIYSQAIAEVIGDIPKFQFVVMSRMPGPVKVWDATRSGQQILDAFDRAREIYDLIEAQQFDCSCGRHSSEAA